MQNFCVVFLIYFEIRFLINAHLKKWCQYVDQIIFTNFQKSIDNVIWFKRFICIQFFYNFDHFFFNDFWTVHQHQIRCAKNVTQISRKWNRKKFIGQKSCFVFKKCCQSFVNVFLRVFDQRKHFQQFIQNMIFDFDSFDQTSWFFLFMAFISIVFQNFKIFVLRMIFCL